MLSSEPTNQRTVSNMAHDRRRDRKWQAVESFENRGREEGTVHSGCNFPTDLALAELDPHSGPAARQLPRYAGATALAAFPAFGAPESLKLPFLEFLPRIRACRRATARSCSS